MSRLGKITVCLAGGLVLLAGARADDAVNPYAPIVARNVFAIKPPPPPTNDAAQLADPPVKITPNGIMTILGQLQVLFKVAVPAKQGQPARDESYILSEGQAQDEIEVVKIDEKAGLVTFNNHGVVQELALTKAPAGGGGAPAPSGGGGGPSGGFNFPIPRPYAAAGGGPGGGFTSFGNRVGARSANAAAGGGNPGANNNPTGGGNPGGYYGGPANNSLGGQGQNSMSTMSSEEAMAMIAAEHLQAQQQGLPSAAIYPPTELDEEAGIKSTALPTAPVPPSENSNSGRR